MAAVGQVEIRVVGVVAIRVVVGILRKNETVRDSAGRFSIFLCSLFLLRLPQSWLITPDPSSPKSSSLHPARFPVAFPSVPQYGVHVTYYPKVLCTRSGMLCRHCSAASIPPSTDRPAASSDSYPPPFLLSSYFNPSHHLSCSSCSSFPPIFTSSSSTHQPFLILPIDFISRY